MALVFKEFTVFGGGVGVVRTNPCSREQKGWDWVRQTLKTQLRRTNGAWSLLTKTNTKKVKISEKYPRGRGGIGVTLQDWIRDTHKPYCWSRMDTGYKGLHHLDIGPECVFPSSQGDASWKRWKWKLRLGGWVAWEDGSQGATQRLLNAFFHSSSLLHHTLGLRQKSETCFPASLAARKQEWTFVSANLMPSCWILIWKTAT